MGYPPQGNGQASWERALTLVSDTLSYLEVGATPITIALPAVTIGGLPAPGTPARADVVLKYRSVQDTSGLDNYLVGDQTIQVRRTVGGTWTDAIKLVDQQMFTAASIVGAGDAVIGQYDVRNELPPTGSVMECRWVNARAAGDHLNLEDVQIIIRIYY